MKIATSLIVMILVLEVTFASDVEFHKKHVRRGNLGFTAPTAYPTIPPFINKLTSMLFSTNQTSGETPIYSLLKAITSNIYPHIANATYTILKPLNNILNGISSNLYNGLCAPPIGNYAAALLGDGTGKILGTIDGSGMGTGMDTGTGTGTGSGGTPNHTFLQGVSLTGSVNATLNLDSAAFNALLSQLGQTQQSLLAAIQTLGQTPQKYVDGFTSSGKTPQLYLQQIFWQAGTVGGSGTTVQPVGGQTNALQEFLNKLLNSLH